MAFGISRPPRRVEPAQTLVNDNLAAVDQGAAVKKAQVEVEVEVEVAQEDVDDVVEIATRMMMEDEGIMTLEEMQEVGEELDIPPEYIARAQAKLVQDRVKEKQELEAKTAQMRTVKIATVAGIGVMVVVMGIWVSSTASSLGRLHAVAVGHQAQVENVTQRRAAVVELYKNRPDSPDKDAELVGAENRIRVETKRYSEAAAAYNAKARGFPANIARSMNGLPAEFPISR